MEVVRGNNNRLEWKVGVEVERRGWSGSGFWIFEPLKFMRRESGRNTKRLGRDKEFRKRKCGRELTFFPLLF
jgi:hypothetical protein